jgi:flavin reductase (DIM6/NTAB) family NADH-FMN oxidoreductase RutF
MGSDEVHAFVSRQDYPLYVVTTEADGRRDGCLVGFVTQTSIDPCRLLVCLSRRNATLRTAERASHLAVHQVTTAQEDVAELFGGQSGDWTDKFAQCAWHPGPHGMPVLDSCAGWLVGQVLERYDVGDHVGFLLEPVAAGTVDGSTALMTIHRMPPIEPGHSA